MINNKNHLTKEEIQSITFNILMFVDELCTRHDINYSLAYGTLLGAVRHKGFIPWDDDVDIMMTREEYNRFLLVFSKCSKRYILLDPNLNRKYTLPLAKIIDCETVLHETNKNEKMPLGVYIDIFILDKMPPKQKQSQFFKKLDKIENRWSFFQYKKRFKSKIKKAIYSVLIKMNFSHFFGKMLFNDSKKYEHANSFSQYGVVHYSGYGRCKAVFPKEIFDKYLRLSFEGHDFLVVKDYESILKHIYGDYQVLPPVEKRVAHHNFIAYKK